MYIVIIAPHINSSWYQFGVEVYDGLSLFVDYIDFVRKCGRFLFKHLSIYLINISSNHKLIIMGECLLGMASRATTPHLSVYDGYLLIMLLRMDGRSDSVIRVDEWVVSVMICIEENRMRAWEVTLAQICCPGNAPGVPLMVRMVDVPCPPLELASY